MSTLAIVLPKAEYDRRNEAEFRDQVTRTLTQGYDRRSDLTVPFGKTLGFTSAQGQVITFGYNESGQFTIKQDANSPFGLASISYVSSVQTSLEGQIAVLEVDVEAANDAAEAAASSAMSAQTSATNAGNSATAAQTSATNASTSASNAATSATNASNSASNASTSASQASTSASNAAGSASAANISATAAAASEFAAAGSATAASGSASNASSSATQAATSASNAAGSASNASTSATNAANSATSAGNSATAASTSASQASTSATNAGASESAASTSANNAANSATSAGNSATAASGSASNAATSATNAGNSATSAQNSATSAATEASNAATSAGQASTSAGNASTSASQASTSASNAAGSASSASTSATNAANSATSAGNSATAASTSASNASTSATNAGVSASAAQTSATNAAGSASNAASSASTATTQASNASASAASAAASSTLSATFASGSQGSINSSATFADNANATGVPTNWSDWVSGSGCTRIAGIAPQPYAVTIPGGAGIDQGIQQFMLGRISTGWHVIEADVTLVSGALTGAGVHVNWDGGSANLVFATDTDTNGSVIGAGTTGTLYKFRKLVQVTKGSTYNNIYAMSHWSGHGSIAAANSITWHRVALRAASQAEIEARQAKLDLVTANAAISANQAAQATINSAQATTNSSISARVTNTERTARNLFPNPSGNGQFVTAIGTGLWQVTGGTVGNFRQERYDWLGGNVYIDNWASYTAATNRAYYFDVPITNGTYQYFTLSWQGWVAGFTGVYIQLYVVNTDGSTATSSPAGTLHTGAGFGRASVTTGSSGGGSVSFFRVYVVIPAQTTAGYSAFSISQIKIEAGPAATPFTDDTSINGLNTRTTTNEANITANQTAIANETSARAAADTVLTARVDGADANGSLLKNPFFRIPFTSGTIPSGWYLWAATPPTIQHVAAPYGMAGNILYMTANAGANCGIAQTILGGISPGSKYKVGAQVARASGTLATAGIYIAWFTDAGVYISATNIPFVNTPRTDGTTGADPDRVVRYEKELTAPANAYRAEMILMNGWDGFGSVQAAGIYWFEAMFAPSTIAEAAIRTEAEARATADSANTSLITTLTARVNVNSNRFPHPQPLSTTLPSGWGGGIGVGNWEPLGGLFYYKARASGAAVTEWYYYDLEDSATAYIDTNQQYTLSATGYGGTGVSGDRTMMRIELFNSSGTLIHASPYVLLNSYGPRFSTTTSLTSGGEYVRRRVVFQREWAASGSYQDVVFNYIKLERGSAATAYTTEGSSNSLQAGVTTNASAIATVDGKLTASYGVTVDANGRIAQMKLLSNGTTSSVKFTADTFQIFNGSTDVAPFEVTGGNVKIKSANVGTLNIGSGGITIQSGSSGARIVISNSLVEVYDSSRLRVRMGIW